MDREDRTVIAKLVARAETTAEQHLLVALHALERRPKLRVGVEVDSYRIGVVVEQDGRRVAVLVGRTGDACTDVDRAVDDALDRAGWAVFRLPPERVIARPQRAVGDVLAALKEHGREVPRRVPAARRQGVASPAVAAAELRRFFVPGDRKAERR